MRVNYILSFLLIIETAIIVTLLKSPRQVIVKEIMQPVDVVENPIALAARYEAPDKKFEETVKSHHKWLEYRVLGENSFTVLAECAYHRQTNYARILLENGASLTEAMKELDPHDSNAKEARTLLDEVQSQIKVKNGK
jgi:hypothetical protein